MKYQRFLCGLFTNDSDPEERRQRMNTNALRPLAVAVLQTRNGEISGFEDFYLLTWQNTLADIRTGVSDEALSWKLLREVYKEVWNRRSNMPEAGIIRPWIRVLIKDTAKKDPGLVIETFPAGAEEASFKNGEGKASTVLIALEEELGLLNAENAGGSGTKPGKDRKTKNVRVLAALKILLAAAVSCAAGFVIFATVRTIRESTSGMQGIQNGSFETTGAPVPEKTEAESRAALKNGWNEIPEGKKYRNADGTWETESWLEEAGKLYYFDEKGLAVTGTRVLSGQNCTFGTDAALTGISRSYEAETRETILSVQMKQFGREADIKSVVKDSVRQDGGWIYYLYKGQENQKLPVLLRMKKDSGKTELVAAEAGGYLLIGDKIWYSGKEKIGSFAVSGEGVQVGTGYGVEEKDGRYNLVDQFGQKVNGEGGYQTIGGRIYRVEDGRIKYVKPAEQSVGGQTFHLNSSRVDNKIYLSDTSEYLEQGKGIDCMVLVGSRLYYSVILRMEGGNQPYSQIWRTDVDTRQREAVSGVFQGRVLNLYYYSDTGRIFMEYLPGTLKSAYGKIAFLDEEGSFRILNDTGQRKNGYQSGNDMLEMIWEDGDQVYCYWHNCAKDISADGSFEVLDTRTLKLSAADSTAAGETTDTGTGETSASGTEEEKTRTAETAREKETPAAETAERNPEAAGKETKAGTSAAEKKSVAATQAGETAEKENGTKNTAKEPAETGTVAPAPAPGN